MWFLRLVGKNNFCDETLCLEFVPFCVMDYLIWLSIGGYGVIKPISILIKNTKFINMITKPFFFIHFPKLFEMISRKLNVTKLFFLIYFFPCFKHVLLSFYLCAYFLYFVLYLWDRFPVLSLLCPIRNHNNGNFQKRSCAKNYSQLRYPRLASKTAIDFLIFLIK